MGREHIRKAEVNDFRNSYNLVIIGGGMIGPSIAHFARKKLGSKQCVALLESNHSLGQGTSIASLEQGRCGWPDQVVCQMMMTSREILQRPQDYRIKITVDQLGFAKRPYLWLASTDEEIKTYQQLAFVLRRRGVDAEYLDLNLVYELCPWILDTSVRGGMLDRSGFKVDSQTMANAFAESTPDAQFFIDTPAYSIIVEKGKVTGVKTRDGIIKTEKVIIAAGPATRGLVETVEGLTIPIISLPRYSYHSNNRHPALNNSDPFIILKTGAYWRPDGDGILGGYSHKVNGVQRPSQFFPEPGNHFKIDFLKAVWKGLNREGISNPEKALSDPLDFLGSALLDTGPFSKGQVSGGYYVHRENAIEEDRPVIMSLAYLGFPDIFVAAAFSGHGVMSAPAAGMYGAEIFFGNPDQFVDHRNFDLNPPSSQGVSLTI